MWHRRVRLSGILVGLWLGASSVVLSRCNLTDTSESDRGRIAPIEGMLKFWIGESYDPPVEEGEPRLTLFMTTDAEYPCCNFEILNRVGINGDALTVELEGIYEPAICLTALGPATAQSAINLMAGVYSLQFLLGNQTDSYELAVTDSSVSVSGQGQHFMAVERPLVWRLPRRSFAALCGTKTETSWICSDFLDSLRTSGRYEAFQFPDSGYVPYPESSSGYYYDMPAIYFQYAEESDFDAAGKLLERYAIEVLQQYEGVGLSLVNWRNRRYSSWLVED